MSHTSLRPRLAAAVAGAAFAALAVFAPATPASAVLPFQPVTNPCLHLIGTPDPCAPDRPDRPEPVDPSCLRVDVEPLHCPYQP